VSQVFEPTTNDRTTLVERDPRTPEHRRDLLVGDLNLRALVGIGELERGFVYGGERRDVLLGKHVRSKFRRRHAHVGQVIDGPNDLRCVLVVAHECVRLHLVTRVPSSQSIELLEERHERVDAADGITILRILPCEG